MTAGGPPHEEPARWGVALPGEGGDTTSRGVPREEAVTDQMTPRASIASATLVKPAMFAPAT
jgi:hypothetical protein